MESAVMPLAILTVLMFLIMVGAVVWRRNLSPGVKAAIDGEMAQVHWPLIYSFIIWGLAAIALFFLALAYLISSELFVWLVVLLTVAWMIFTSVTMISVCRRAERKPSAR
jgi:hypothetical protein